MLNLLLKIFLKEIKMPQTFFQLLPILEIILMTAMRIQH